MKPYHFCVLVAILLYLGAGLVAYTVPLTSISMMLVGSLNMYVYMDAVEGDEGDDE